jgi:hypothetical protein
VQVQALLVTSVLALVVRSVDAALLVYEPFDYSAGTVLNGTIPTGQNLTGTYTPLGPSLPFQVVVESPGLNYGNLGGVPNSLANRLSQPSGTTAGGASVDLENSVVVNPGDAIYFSALFSFSDLENGNHLANVAFTNDENGDTLSFGEAAVGVRAIRITAETVATGQLVAAGADNAFSNGDTLLLLGRYLNSAAPDGDTLHLIGYDTADSDLLPLTFDPTDPNAEFAYSLTGVDIDLTKITSIHFRIRGNDNNFIDELRIGSTYADVIPEPMAAALYTIGACALTIWINRRSQGSR